MKKYFLSFIFSLFCLLMLAQPAYLAGSSSGFKELNSTPSGSNMLVETRLNTNVAIKTCSAKADYSAWFKFTSANSSWSPQWSVSGAEKTITTNNYLASTAEYIDGQNLKIEVKSGKYYTFIVGQNSSSDNDLSVLLSNEAPKIISSVNNASPAKNVDIQVSATLSSAIVHTSGEGAQYVRMAYTTDNTSYVTVNMNASGTTYTANIPASVNLTGVTLSYFVYITPIPNLTPSDENFDYLYFTKSETKSYCVECTIPTSIVIKAKRPSSWTEDMYIFYWGGELESATWNDAEKMENIGNDWYSYTFNSAITVTNIIFKNNNNKLGDANQTVDINAVSSDVCYELSQSGSAKATYSETDCPGANQDTSNPEIRSHRNKVNENDFSDFASLYIYSKGNLDSEDFIGATKYLWQKSNNGSDWSDFSEGRKNNINNIRPVKAGYYRCLVSKYCVSASKDSTLVSNQIKITNTNGPKKTISSNLPIIIVRTDVQDFPTKPSVNNGFLSSNEALAAGKEKRSVDVKIIWDETSTDDQTNIYTGNDVTDSARLYYDKKARMNYRGSSSMNNDRRNYAFAVGDDSCTVYGTWTKDKKKMFNLNNTKDKDWILYAADTDDTKMRNMLAMSLYENMTGTWNSHGRYVRLYVNGEDKGIYVFMEKNKKESSRVQVDNDGYLFKFDKTDLVDRFSSTDGDRSTFTTDKTGWLNIRTYGLEIDQAFEIVYPEWDEADFTQETWNQRVLALKSRIVAFETALAAGNYSSVRNYIDYESWADNFIINEYTKNADGYRISQFFNMTSASGLIKAAPLWDMELGFNNPTAYGAVDKGCNSTSGIMAENAYVHSDSFTIPFWWTGSDRTIKGKGLLNDNCFKAKVKERWLKHTAVGGALNASSVQEEINKLITPLNISVPTVISNWVHPTSGRPAGLNSIISGYPTYLSSVSMNDVSNVALGNSIQMSVSVSGTDNYTYSWYYSATNSSNESDWTLLTNNGTAIYSISNAKTTDDGFYKCVVTSQTCDCINMSVVARLSISAVNVIVYSDDDSMGYVTGAGSYPKGSNVTITAIPNSGYEFSHWDDGNTDNPRVFNNVQEEIEYAASFEATQYSLSISAGLGGTVNSSINGNYAYGTVKQLIASANTGYKFVSWSDGVLDATRNLTLTSDTTLTASFDIIKYLITVNAGVGGVVYGGGSYNYNQSVVLSASPNVGYSFKQWNDGVSTASRTIVVTSDASYTASFSIDQYTVSVTSGSGGSVNNVSGTYDYGSSIELKATPAANHHFVSWSDGNTQSTRTITVQSALSLSASFSIDQYTVSVLKSGTGGSVSGGGTFDYGTSITIKATPYTGYKLKKWNDGNTTASRTIIVTKDEAYIAEFEKEKYTLIISAGPNGTVNTEVNGIYDYGTSVEIKAIPFTNASFVSWSDGDLNASRLITISNNTVLEAQFAIDNYTLNILALANGTVNTEINGTYPSGSQLTLQATPNAHYHFSKWSDGDKNAQRTLTLTKNTVLYASFEINKYSLTISSSGNGTVNSQVNKDYTYGTSVEIKATPNEHSDFVSWSDGNTNPIRTIVMDADIQLSANFSLKQYELQVSSGPNGKVNSEISGSYTYGSIVTLKAIASEHYHFDSWSDGNTNAEFNLIITKDENLSALFKIDRFELKLTADNNKGYVNSEVNGEYDYNTQLTIIAQAKEGFVFKYWSDGNTNSERIVNMTENISLSAIFEVSRHTLNISAVGNGTVNTEVNGEYDYGTEIEIVVSPNNHYHFESWSDANTERIRTIRLISDTLLVAYIEPDLFVVSAAVYGSGRVEGTGAYEYNREITITAIPDANHHFTTWSDGNVNQERTVVVKGDMHFVANFAINKHTINIVAGKNGMVNSGLNGSYDYGTQLTIVAAANSHYHFDSWSDGSVELERTIELTQDTTLIANFAIDQFTVFAETVGNGNVEGAGVYDYGTNVTITAIPDAHTHFVSWSDGNINEIRQIILVSDITMIAEFAVDKHIVTLLSDANGSVIGAGEFDYNSEITIKAIPDGGYVFDKWSDENTEAERVIIVKENISYTAYFSKTVSVEDAILEKPNIYAIGRTIYIIAPNANSIIVYDKIGKTRAINVNSLTVPHAGVYFIKVDSKTYKLTVY